MSSLHTAFAAIIVLTTTLTAWGDKPAKAMREHVISLRNGSILRGQVTQLGDRYLVRLPRGGEVRIPLSQVELVADDLGGVYRYKQQKLRFPRAEDHLRLAHWCLMHHLVLRAIDEVEQARRLDPRCKGLGLAERRLQSATRQSTRKKSLTTPSGSKAETQDITKLVGSLPEGGMHRFTTAVQPLLINRCGGCHGQHARTRFKLHRGVKGRAVPRRFTQLNLYAALKNVNRQWAEQSPLLTKTIVPHGNSSEAIFSEKNRQEYELLQSWVRSVVNDKPATRMAKAPPAIPQPTSSFLLQPEKAGRQKSPQGPKKYPVQPASLNIPAGDRGRQPQRRDIGGKPDTIARDPFDAEVFNRRFHGKNERRSAVPPGGPKRLRPNR